MQGKGQMFGVALASLIFASPALAIDDASVTFAQFTQQSSDKVAVFGNTGTSNTLTITDAPANFVVTAFGPSGVYQSSFSLNASSSAQVVDTGPQFEQQGWDGTMSFVGGLSQLAVQFKNATFNYDGLGGSGSLISTDPFNVINFSSDFLTLPTFDFTNFSLAFTAITSPFTIADNGLGTAFDSNVAGSFAGSAVVPEPESWAMLVLGFGMIGWVTRRRATGLVHVNA